MSTGLLNLQHRVADFMEEHGLEAPVQARALDLTSKVGGDAGSGC